CFHSLTTALCCYKGASLKGFQGVGKTETLKDLSRLLGNYALVINCSQNLDHISLIRMISGIAQIGAWGCFEEFSCIKIEILSVLSQEINSILNALSSKRYFFPFWGMDTPVQENCGLFLTINPVSYYHGYNLPPLLSDLFRPVSMISPDIEAIIQINLFALGFKEPKILAADIYLMYKMIAEQLSKKDYYSFDLRSVCKFLKVLRNQKRNYENFPDHEVIAASLRNSSMSELHADDVPIFEDILENILSGVKEIKKDLSVITNAVKNILSKKSLQLTHATLSKIIQFFEQLQFHHAIIILGESGCGKTTTWETLKEVFDHLQSQNVENFSSVHTYLLNPKAFSNKELFGHFKAAGVWQNGLFPTVLKEANRNEKIREKWIILDGPIDDKWVGNIHALLDSSKVLTVSNGERILLLPEVSVIFETTDIIHCSPSVISRCGIVYHGTATVSCNTRICSWLQQIENDAVRKTMEEVIDVYFEYVIDFSLSNLKSLKLMCSTSPSYISSFCKIVDAFIKK
ncbi:dynein heavy chain 2, axonemal-like, partial [Stegodyphus dumicola]|uniref:dynein heavy chain 2, axonemal-like n=1 Tax=Stegodyphus dumicola TaxID=202533 RepID=UPI0015ADD46F